VPPVHVAGMPPDVESPSNPPASEARRRVSRRQVRDFLDAMADGEAADPAGAAPDPGAPPGVGQSAAKLDALAAALAAGGSFGGGQAPSQTDEAARRRFGEALRNAMGARNSPPAQDDPGGDP